MCSWSSRDTHTARPAGGNLKIFGTAISPEWSPRADCRTARAGCVFAVRPRGRTCGAITVGRGLTSPWDVTNAAPCSTKWQCRSSTACNGGRRSSIPVFRAVARGRAVNFAQTRHILLVPLQKVLEVYPDPLIRGVLLHAAHDFGQPLLLRRFFEFPQNMEIVVQVQAFRPCLGLPAFEYGGRLGRVRV